MAEVIASPRREFPDQAANNDKYSPLRLDNSVLRRLRERRRFWTYLTVWVQRIVFTLRFG